MVIIPNDNRNLNNTTINAQKNNYNHVLLRSIIRSILITGIIYHKDLLLSIVIIQNYILLSSPMIVINQEKNRGLS